MGTYLKFLTLPLFFLFFDLWFFISKWKLIPNIVPRQCDINGIPNAFWPKIAALSFSSGLVFVFILIISIVIHYYNEEVKKEGFSKLNLIAISLIANPIIALIIMINHNVISLQINSAVKYDLSWIQIILVIIGSIMFTLLLGLLHDKNKVMHSETNLHGIFYSDATNKSIWVEKESGLGWTLNFAHKKSYFILASLLLIVLIVLILPNILIKMFLQK